MALANATQETKLKEIAEAAEADLEVFIRLVAPKRLLGSVHVEWIRWATRQDALDYQLLLLPRDHMKSALAAFYVAWRVTREPHIRVAYLSATSNLAEKQLKFIKDILTSSIYKRYWPDMLNPDENKREKWTNSEISVDHPKRKEESIRDPTIFTGGLTTSLTGLHFDLGMFDDAVVYENAYTEEGRNRVKSQFSLLMSVAGAEAQIKVCGTRYHPKDLYNECLEMKEDVYDDDGNVIEERPIFEIFERQVEDRGDGSGEFLWPRQQRSDGQWFGFNREILARKRGTYLDKTQFRAQYYNDPNDPGDARIDRSKFQYYEKDHLSFTNGSLYYKADRLNVFAAVDFAYSVSKRADYTSIVVIGCDVHGNYYILDIDRFKTDSIAEYFKHILALHTKWDFRKISAEVTAAQQSIVRELKDSYIKPYGIALSVVETKPTRHQGTKEERMAAILEPKYDNNAMWHYRGGNCQTLEEELLMTHPPHDDCMDALANAIEIAVPPSGMRRFIGQTNVVTHSRFGGVRF